MSDTAYPTRKRIRLSSYDYSGTGTYHIVICTAEKEKILSDIIPPKSSCDLPTVVLSPIGEKIKPMIEEIGNVYPEIRVIEYCIMPNHVHILITCTGGEKKLGTVISQLKGKASKTVGRPLWQKGFYDHIIRGEADFYETVKYIRENSIKWTGDLYF